MGVAIDHQVRNSWKRLNGEPYDTEWAIPEILFTWVLLSTTRSETLGNV